MRISDWSSDVCSSDLIWFGATGTTRQFGPNCDVGEIIIFDRPLTGSEKALIEGYLAHKWERADLLPAAHPYKANPPGMAEPESAGHAHSASQPVLTLGGSVTVHGGSHGHDADQASLTAFGLTLDDIAGHRIFQRNGTEAAIALSGGFRSEEHTSELQSLMRISYAVFCLKKKR